MPKPPKGQQIVDVVVPLALDQAYSYRVPAGMTLEPGDFVNVSLGQAEYTGVVWGEGNPRPGLQVPAGAEMAVGTVEHRHPRFSVGIERDECLVQGARRVGVDGVAHIGPVQRHHCHLLELLDPD